MTVRLLLGDCLEVLPRLDGPFDAIITDLPYGTTACKWDTVIPFAPMWAQVKRLLKPRGAFVTTASQPFTSALVMSNAEWFRYCWVWRKSRPNGFLDANRKPMRAHEDICVFGDAQAAYNPQGLRLAPCQNKNTGRENVYGGVNKGWVQNVTYTNYPCSVLEFPSISGGTHPTQKPVALYEYLIRTYTNEGDTVLDFCMGSGTTGVAAVNTGRSFVGVELDAGYFAIAQRRIREAQQQLTMPLETATI